MVVEELGGNKEQLIEWTGRLGGVTPLMLVF